jgi:hypothetical protein
MSLFKNADGTYKYSIVLAIVAAITVGIVALLHNEFAYNFTHRFWRAGIWQIVGPIIGSIFGYIFYKKYSDDKGSFQGLATQILAVFIYFSTLIAPATALRSNREQGIPDVNLWITKGKPINVTDSTKSNYFFNYYTLSPEDSVHTVLYGEVPESVDLIKAKKPAAEVKY